MKSIFLKYLLQAVLAMVLLQAGMAVAITQDDGTVLSALLSFAGGLILGHMVVKLIKYETVKGSK